MTDLAQRDREAMLAAMRPYHERGAFHDGFEAALAYARKSPTVTDEMVRAVRAWLGVSDSPTAPERVHHKNGPCRPKYDAASNKMWCGEHCCDYEDCLPAESPITSERLDRATKALCMYRTGDPRRVGEFRRDVEIVVANLECTPGDGGVVPSDASPDSRAPEFNGPSGSPTHSAGSPSTPYVPDPTMEED